MDAVVRIVMPVLDNAAVTAHAAAALAERTSLPYDLVLVDNGSGDQAAKLLRDLRARGTPRGRVLLIRNDENHGFAYAVNQGLAAALDAEPRCRWLVVMNNDVLVTTGWLERMIAAAERDTAIGLVGPRTNRASGPQQLADCAYDDAASLEAFAARLATEHAAETTPLARLVGLCLLVRREVVEEIGGFDTCFWLGNFEDDDFCLRALRRGFRGVMAGDAFVHHDGSATFRGARIDYARLMHDNWRWFRHKWDFEQPLGAYPARALAQARPFDAGRDVVPVRFADVYHPGAEPLPLEGARSLRLLLIADGTDDAWIPCLERHLAEFTPDDDATLVLRVEPPAPDAVEHVAAALEAVLARSGRSEEACPDVLVEANPIPARRRGGLFTAVTAFVRTDSDRAPMHVRAARACGIPVFDAAHLAAMKR